jgi:predicted nucleic acid-binding protein
VISTYLLDTNAVIALVITEHEHHDRIALWSTSVNRIALCPITEGAMVRYLIRVGETGATALGLLAALHQSTRTDFWPDSMSYVESELKHVTGHRQVTDAYLASLAASHRSRLATFDNALAAALPEHVDLIP